MATAVYLFTWLLPVCGLRSFHVRDSLLLVVSLTKALRLTCAGFDWFYCWASREAPGPLHAWSLWWSQTAFLLARERGLNWDTEIPSRLLPQ